MEAPFTAYGMKICGFAAALGTDQMPYYLTGIDPKRIFSGCDYFYPSEGEIGFEERKQFATDFALGTFPNAKACIEVDDRDLGSGGVLGGNLNPNILLTTAEQFFKRGGSVLHFAMSFGSGANGEPDNISSLVPVLKYIKDTYLDQTGPSYAIAGSIIVETGGYYSNSDFYKDNWRDAGGRDTNPLRVIQYCDLNSFCT
jgi:hypothetical protein